jgi:NTE family protein
MHQKGFKDLYITSTCLNKQKSIVFSHITYPKMKIRDAVRISTSIPLYFEPLYIDSIGNMIYRPKQKEGLDLVLDGGFLENFPIHIFDDLAPDMNTIGFRIDSELQVENDKTDRTLVEMPIENLNQYFGAFYNITMENLNRQRLTTEDWQRTVSISDGNVQPRVRKLSKEELDTLINNGKKAVQERFH